MGRAAGLNVAAGGNFGPPALDLLADASVDMYVLELSSFQLELTETLAPDVACVLNVSPDHMDRHDGIEAYAALKARIYRNAGHAVVNVDDARVAAMTDRGATTTGFGAGAPDATQRYGLRRQADVLWLARGTDNLIAADQLRLRGAHNLVNALAALALGERAGLAPAAMLAALVEFPGLAHRCQWVASIGGVEWVNDSKGTNVGALLASLQGLAGPIVLLAGGQAKGADFAPVGPVLAQKGRLAVLFGVDAPRIETLLKEHVAVRRVADLGEAVRAAADAACPGDTVLLSPGCASQDQFRDYADRGDQFTAAVRRLAA